jgi:hypothetical protein
MTEKNLKKVNTLCRSISTPLALEFSIIAQLQEVLDATFRHLNLAITTFIIGAETSSTRSTCSTSSLETFGFRFNVNEGRPPRYIDWHNAAAISVNQICLGHRDHIFGVQALLKPEDQLIVDYNMSTEDAFHAFSQVVNRKFRGEHETWCCRCTIKDLHRTLRLPANFRLGAGNACSEASLLQNAV